MLKPNDEYGGKGIVLGWTVDRSATWEQAVQTALAEPYVVQERVDVPQRAVPELGRRQAALRSTACWTRHPFVGDGELHGRLPDAHLDRGAAQRHRRRRLDRADVRRRARDVSRNAAERMESR